MKLDIRLAGMLDTPSSNSARAVAAKPESGASATSFGAVLTRLAGNGTDQLPGMEGLTPPAIGNNLPSVAVAVDISITDFPLPTAHGEEQLDIGVSADAAILPVPLLATAIQTDKFTDALTAAQGSGNDGYAALAVVVAPVAPPGGLHGAPPLRSASYSGAATGTAIKLPAQHGSGAVEAGTTADAPTLSLQPAPASSTDGSFSLADHELKQLEPSGRAASHDADPHSSASPVQNNHGAGRPPLSGVITTLTSQLATPQWQQEFSQQMVSLVQRGEHRVSLHLNPAQLGPLVVDMEISEQHALLQFASGHAQVRSALEQALPQLRDALAEQGISLGETHIGSERDEQQAFSFRGKAAEAEDALGTGARSEPPLQGVTAVIPSEGRVNLYV